MKKWTERKRIRWKKTEKEVKEGKMMKTRAKHWSTVFLRKNDKKDQRRDAMVNKSVLSGGFRVNFFA